MKLLPLTLSVIALAALCACGDSARLPVEAGFGANPELPAPNETLLPTVNIALPQGWTGGGPAHARTGHAGQRLREWARPSALAACAAER